MLRLIIVLTVIVSFLLRQSANSQTVFVIDPRGTYLRTHQDSPQPALVVNLANLSLTPGHYIRLEVLGACSPGVIYSDDYYTTIGVFSSDSNVLASNQRHRVPGAIMSCGEPYISPNTYYSSLPTDIPEDFLIASHLTGQRVALVRIPERAAFLLVCYADVLYHDNRDPNGDYRIVISRTNASGDVNGDDDVDDLDLLAVLFAFGQTCNCPEDLNNDGMVDDADLLLVLFHFGEGC